MKTKSYTLSLAKTAFLLACLILLFVDSGLNACGLSPTLPSRGRFVNVDRDGNVDIWSEIVAEASSDEIPLAINFNSSRNSVSAFLGIGWMFPFFESKIYQTNDDTFKFLAINGQTQVLIRSKTDPNNIAGGDWGGRIRESLIQWSEAKAQAVSRDF